MMIMNDDTTQNGYFSSSSDLKREKTSSSLLQKGEIHPQQKKSAELRFEKT